MKKRPHCTNASLAFWNLQKSTSICSALVQNHQEPGLLLRDAGDPIPRGPEAPMLGVGLFSRGCCDCLVSAL